MRHLKVHNDCVLNLCLSLRNTVRFQFKVIDQYFHYLIMFFSLKGTCCFFLILSIMSTILNNEWMEVSHMYVLSGLELSMKHKISDVVLAKTKENHYCNFIFEMFYNQMEPMFVLLISKICTIIFIFNHVCIHN